MKLEYFELSVGAIVKRFFLLMGVVIVAGFSGQWWLAAFALPVLLSAMVGVKITFNKETKVKTMKKQTSSNQLRQAAEELKTKLEAAGAKVELKPA